MYVKKAVEKIGPKVRAVSSAASSIGTPTDAGQLTGKVGLVTGGSNKVGLQIGIKLAEKFKGSASGSRSRIYLTTRYEKTISDLEEALAKACDHDEEIMSSIIFTPLDLRDKGSLFKLYRKIKDEAMSLDILVNNARKFVLPSQSNEELFKEQCGEALQVNYEGMKRICKTFTPMLNQAGRIVLCSSHLGHLSNIDGNEPYAYKLRKRFADKNLNEDKLDRLIKEFQDHVNGDFGQWVQNGWPSCPFTVSNIAVNAYSRILQDRLDRYHEQKKLVVNAVHHGYNHRKMNTVQGFPAHEAAEFVANMATLAEGTHIKGKILWKGTETFDGWEYGGLDDGKQSKPFCAIYDMEKDAEKMQDTNTGFCLAG